MSVTRWGLCDVLLRIEAPLHHFTAQPRCINILWEPQSEMRAALLARHRGHQGAWYGYTVSNVCVCDVLKNQRTVAHFHCSAQVHRHSVRGHGSVMCREQLARLVETCSRHEPPAWFHCLVHQRHRHSVQGIKSQK